MGTFLKNCGLYKSYVMSFLWSSETSDSERSCVGEKSPDVSKKPGLEKESNSDKEIALKSENKSEAKDVVAQKSDSEVKKATKRPIESHLSEEESESKKSKNVQAERNEISCSFSSSTVKKRQADFADDSDQEQEKGVKKLKEDVVGSSKSPLKRHLKFEAELSPKKMLKHLQKSVAKEEYNDSTKELISDIEAFKADQERSEERGRKLMQAFEED